MDVAFLLKCCRLGYYFDNVTFERLANEFAATWGEAALRQLNEATQVAFATGSTRFQPPCNVTLSNYSGLRGWRLKPRLPPQSRPSPT